MHPELLAAVKERIALGHSKETIKTELQGAGYDDLVIEQVYSQAQSGSTDGVESATPPSYTMSGGEGEQSATLPGATTLFSNGWSFVMSRLDLVAIIAAPMVVGGVVGYLADNYGAGENTAAVLVVSIIGLIAFVFYILNIGALLHTVTRVSERRVSYGEALTWSKGHIIGLLWVNLLVGLVVMGGYLLFIIPGIILTFALYLSQYVYANENVRGLSALLRSRDLVKGNAWTLAGRLIVLGLIMLAVFIGLGIPAGIAVGIAGEGGVTDLVTGILFQLIGAGASMIGIHAGMELYRNLAAARPASAVATTPKGRGKYITLAWLGFLFVPLIFFLAITLAALNVAQEKGMEAQLEEMMIDVDTKERALEMRAEQLRQEIIEAEEELNTVSEPSI